MSDNDTCFINTVNCLMKNTYGWTIKEQRKSPRIEDIQLVSWKTGRATGGVEAEVRKSLQVLWESQ